MNDKDNRILSDHGQLNLLNLDEPEKYKCHIQHYLRGHSRIAIILFKDRVHTRISLSPVHYFSGPVRWVGASISTATEAECLSLIQQVGLDKKHIHDYRLFIIENDTSVPVEILAYRSLYLYNVEEFAKIRDDRLIQRITIDSTTDEPCIIWEHVNPDGSKGYGKCSVAEMLSQFERGHTFEEVKLLWPDLEPEDIQACLVYARRAVQNMSGGNDVPF